MEGHAQKILAELSGEKLVGRAGLRRCAHGFWQGWLNAVDHQHVFAPAPQSLLNLPNAKGG
ncbi:hypothetical protein VB780_15785 [Leptolyngbya sp. CCNP1308]|uniref:hypothetical protein n=1 Tax=Leptolyngbya sp. CCNP1308 TaxID=3110255 RepID=UPI002B20E238|nr:hypothetical protein [Leptolyngbya sp. CCNP1308]MEA5450042.1 hypothetical protein [Leptolyngbya sp. CCNP1308]